MGDCGVRLRRHGMNDDQFWVDVSKSFVDPDDVYEDFEPDDITTQPDVCRVCGEWGACGYDSEGRPLIHVSEEDDE